jgi:hypothetical protein
MRFTVVYEVAENRCFSERGEVVRERARNEENPASTGVSE